ncbi:MAG: PorT family protein [Dysgonamonadaceae bacterium]|nr:PorT family protein [Dysgonamonadaceae bacterium]
MKRIFFTTVIIALAVFSAEAQIKVGVKAGVGTTSTSFKGDVINDLESNFTGFHVGPIIDVTLPLTGIGFDAAVLYSQKGFKIKNIDLEERASTVDFPVNLKIKMPVSQKVKIFAAAGPYLSFKLAGDKFDFSEATQQIEDIWENKSFGVGANIGGGFIIDHLQIGFNYRVSFSDEYESLDYSDLSGKSKGWYLEMAYYF